LGKDKEMMNQHDMQLLSTGEELTTRICQISADYADQGMPQTRLTMSFDVLCTLVEYTVLQRRLVEGKQGSVEELLMREQLTFDTSYALVPIAVDYFAEKGTFKVE
jgi:hypothetical protein